MSTDAKTLYGILLDRMSLSVKNGWLDGQGRVYIIFPVQEVMDALGCADNKATKLFRELENAGLVERKRRGLGKPNPIYVKNFADPRYRNSDKMVILPFSLLTAFLALMLKLTLNLSAFVLALPMLYIFGCGLYTLYCREWTQFLLLFVAEFGCFLLIVAGMALVEAVERFSEWLTEL